MEPKGIIKGIGLDSVFKIGDLEFKRIDDVIIEIGGKDIISDAKAWSPDHIRQYLNYSMSGKLIQGELQQDQVFKDILYMNKNKDYKSIRWAFDSRNKEYRCRQDQRIHHGGV